jgi:MarR family transcriptional regulator for hemolysin
MADRDRMSLLQWRLGRALGQISRRWRSRLDGRMAAFGLTEARWLPLLHLARWGDGLTQKELATSLGVEGPTLVRTLDWLEREGLVERRAAEADRRAKRVHLTPRAVALHREIEREAAAVRADLLDGISEAELLACLGVLDRIAARLGAPPPPKAEPARTEDRVGHRAA